MNFSHLMCAIRVVRGMRQPDSPFFRCNYLSHRLRWVDFRNLLRSSVEKEAIFRRSEIKTFSIIPHLFPILYNGWISHTYFNDNSSFIDGAKK